MLKKFLFVYLFVYIIGNSERQMQTAKTDFPSADSFHKHSQELGQESGTPLHLHAGSRDPSTSAITFFLLESA